MSIDYIGSKNKLAPRIAEVIERNVGDLEGVNFAELFAGTGAVSRYMLSYKKLESITTNDFEIYSRAICVATIRNIPVANRLYQHLNGLEPKFGFISKHCSPIGTEARRMFFTPDNAMKIDAIKEAIISYYNSGLLTSLRCIKLLGELIIAADRISNTASVYGAYLKKFKKTALVPIRLINCGPKFNDIKIMNFMDYAQKSAGYLSGDVVYLDPPYNHRQYGANYHVLNFIGNTESEQVYKPVGISGLDKKWTRSQYCNREKAAAALNLLIATVNFKFVVMSYSNEGLLSIPTIKMIMEEHGEIIDTEIVTNYRKFNADNDRHHNNKQVDEYIIVLRKN